MTASTPLHAEPLLEDVATVDLDDGGLQRSRTAREPSLTEMMSLSDWRRFVPESLGLLVVISLAGPLLPGSFADVGTPTHSFWIPVLLMSCQYGIMGGLFTTLAATAALFVNGLPPQSAGQDFYAYAGVVAAQPCAWFAAALVLGGLRTLHMHHLSDLRDRFEQTALMAEDFAGALTRAVGEIERLEHRIATDCSSLAGFLHSLARLDLRDRRSLLASVADIIRFGVGASSFVIFLRRAHELEPYLGVDDGTHLAPAAMASLRLSLLEQARGTIADIVSASIASRFPGAPVWALIHGTADSEPIGAVVCTRLLPSQDDVGAARRLDQVCRILAVLLSASPEPSSDAG
jgi:hypothetical protein